MTELAKVDYSDDFLKRSLYFAYEKLLDESLGLVTPNDCYFVLSEEAGRQVAAMPETTLAIRVANHYLTDEEKTLVIWGIGSDKGSYKLPLHLYGFPVAVARHFHCSQDPLKMGAERVMCHVKPRKFACLSAVVQDPFLLPVNQFFSCEIQLPEEPGTCPN